MAWLDEVDLYVGTAPLMIRSNIYDIYQYGSHYLSIKPFLTRLLRSKNSDADAEIVIVDIEGYTGVQEKDVKRAVDNLDSQKQRIGDYNNSMPYTQMAKTVRALVQTPPSENCTKRYVIMDLSPCIVPNTHLSSDQAHLFHEIFEACSGIANGCGFIMLAPDELSVPSWLTNAGVFRTISIPKPNFQERRAYCNELFQGNEAIDWLAAVTEGYHLKQLRDIHTLALEERTTDLRALFRLYSQGVREDPWLQRKDILHDFETELHKRVKGQNYALSHVSSALRRIILGLSSATQPSDKRRVRGVLFLAGSTGVGKTETVKAITERVFGSSDHMIRIQCNELSEPHAALRLFGAPPSYVGYEAGGQLTNAVSRKPHSVIIFDEIEKAHQSLQDKVLQILDEGIATDGKGQTISFEDTIIIFSSNIGTYTQDADDKIQPLPHDMPYEQLKKNVMSTLKSSFKPEFIGRLTDIIVYAPLTTAAAREIYDLMLSRVKQRVHDLYGVDCFIEDECADFILSHWDQSRGARGIDVAIQHTILRSLEDALMEGVTPGQTIRFTLNAKKNAVTYQI